MFKQFKELLNKKKHTPSSGIGNIQKYIGPGLLVTVGFIDPGTGPPTWRRSRIRLFTIMDGHPVHDHADRVAA